jgi:hypothetical protein
VGIAPLNLCCFKQMKRDVYYVAEAEPAAKEMQWRVYAMVEW